MILDNYKNCFVCMQRSSSQNVTNFLGNSVSLYTSNVFKNVVGQTVGAYVETLSAGVSAVDIGFGNTPESASDYKLADGNTSNQLLTIVNYGKNSAGIGDIINAYLNVRNNDGANVTVKEIGFYTNPTNSGSTGGNNTVLLLRKVLDTPVTIAPGETYSFTYVLRFKNA